jgi:DivIVA domain-containing protein
MKKDERRGSNLTPEDIQAKEFGVARFGGYKMHDVDEFLDLVTVALQEAQRRAEPDVSNAVIGAPDLAEVGRQADEIIRRAREEAARILAEAERRAGAARGADREVLTPYLEREREFLASIAGLVQNHAESIKSMVRAASRPGVEGQAHTVPAGSASRGETPAPVPSSTPRHVSASVGSPGASSAEGVPAVVIPPTAGDIAPGSDPNETGVQERSAARSHEDERDSGDQVKVPSRGQTVA